IVASDTSWRRMSADGRVVAEGQPPDDTDAIQGIAGDPASGTVYLVLPSEVVAVSAQDGAVRWREPVEGSGNPALGSGLIVVPGGEGDVRGGDGLKGPASWPALSDPSRPRYPWPMSVAEGVLSPPDRRALTATERNWLFGLAIAVGLAGLCWVVRSMEAGAAKEARLVWNA